LATLFLDEIDELPMKLQRLLANLLVEYRDDHNRQSDRGPICIVSSSTRDLRRETKEGHFRRDLLQQLAVVTIEVPPLRNRMEDLPGICEYLRYRCCRASGMPDRPFPADLWDRMLHHPWPGNFSELESFISRFVALGPKHCDALGNLKPDVSGDPGIWLM
jgi:DNA-binding NtrC family response regulator